MTTDFGWLPCKTTTSVDSGHKEKNPRKNDRQNWAKTFRAWLFFATLDMISTSDMNLFSGTRKDTHKQGAGPIPLKNPQGLGIKLPVATIAGNLIVLPLRHEASIALLVDLSKAFERVNPSWALEVPWMVSLVACLN